ncbi:hypothetical protein Hanom_Chr00s002873g01706511 [Helianthus anomalus]
MFRNLPHHSASKFCRQLSISSHSFELDFFFMILFNPMSHFQQLVLLHFDVFLNESVSPS